MKPKVIALMGDFAVEISSVNLNTSLTNHQFQTIHSAVDSHGVAVFHNQFIDDDALIAAMDAVEGRAAAGSGSTPGDTTFNSFPCTRPCSQGQYP